MKLAISGTLTDEFLTYGRQLGATDVVGGTHELGKDRGYYDFNDLMWQKQKIVVAGLRWAVLEGVPAEWCHKIKLGLPGRDEQIDNWCRSLRNMGEAGIPVLGYFFSLRSRPGNFGLRTSRSTLSRGGAVVTSFDYELIKGAKGDYWDPPVTHVDEITDDEIWANHEYFLKAVIPVAEEAGVKMGLHPDDPPISPIAGVARVFRSHDALKKHIELVPSDYNGLGFCHGTISEMDGDVKDAIRYFGERGKIFYVHFRSVSGTVPAFTETFIDEGHADVRESMRAFKEVGFDGAMIDDHVPKLVVDTEQSHVAHAYAMGYMKSLLDAV
jgi:mannonate dehydratase